MILIIPPRTPESLRAEAEWLSRQPPWVVRAYAGVHGLMLLAVVAIIAWGVWMEAHG
ncbi:hypothetical protein [Methylobacterium fujisawaense]